MAKTIPEQIILSQGGSTAFSSPADTSQTRRTTRAPVCQPSNTQNLLLLKVQPGGDTVHSYNFKPNLALRYTLCGLIIYTDVHSLLYPAEVLALVSQTEPAAPVMES